MIKKILEVFMSVAILFVCTTVKAEIVVVPSLSVIISPNSYLDEKVSFMGYKAEGAGKIYFVDPTPGSCLLVLLRKEVLQSPSRIKAISVANWQLS